MWDDAAVRRASRDNNSLVYGFLLIALAASCLTPFLFLAQRSLTSGYPIPWSLMPARYVQLLIVSLLWIVLQIGLSHYLAKLFLDAKEVIWASCERICLDKCFVFLYSSPPLAVCSLELAASPY